MHQIIKLSILSLCLFSYCEGQQPEMIVKIQINKELSKGTDVIIDLELINNSDRPISIPIPLDFGIKSGSPYDELGDVVWEVQKLQDSGFVRCEFDGSLQRVPIFDRGSRILKSKESLAQDFPLDVFYRFTSGNYRVRAMYKGKDGNTLYYSEWLLFSKPK